MKWSSSSSAFTPLGKSRVVCSWWIDINIPCGELKVAAPYTLQLHKITKQIIWSDTNKFDGCGCGSWGISCIRGSCCRSIGNSMYSIGTGMSNRERWESTTIFKSFQ